MTPEEYRQQAHNIEANANAALDAQRRSFTLFIPPHRSARYASGMADVLRELAIAPQREHIEADMHAAMEHLDSTFYGEEAAS